MKGHKTFSLLRRLLYLDAFGGISSHLQSTMIVFSCLLILLSTGSRRHSDAAHEIRLIGCCVLLKVVLKNVPCSGSSQMLSVDWHHSKRCIYFVFKFWYLSTFISTNPKYYLLPKIYIVLETIGIIVSFYFSHEFLLLPHVYK